MTVSFEAILSSKRGEGDTPLHPYPDCSSKDYMSVPGKVWPKSQVMRHQSRSKKGLGARRLGEEGQLV